MGKDSIIWIAISFLLPATFPAMAGTDLSKCILPKGLKSAVRLADLPLPIRSYLPGMGPPDGAIRTDASMLHDNRPVTRFNQAFSRGNLWAVVYETGGFANYRKVTIFSLSDDGKRATLTGTQTGPFEEGVCAILKGTFAGNSK